jgi:hypothetical protein
MKLIYMTYNEWQLCTDWDQMWRHFEALANGRELRLYKCACCRHFWDDIPTASMRRAVECTEAALDNLSPGSRELHEFYQAAGDAMALGNPDYMPMPLQYWTEAIQGPLFPNDDRGNAVKFLAKAVACKVSLDENAPGFVRMYDDAMSVFRDLLRDFWCPDDIRHCLLSFISSKDSSAVDVAKQIYESRDYTLFAKLWGVLNEGGCFSQVIHDHCNKSARHARGCWLLDTLLQKRRTSA